MSEPIDGSLLLFGAIYAVVLIVIGIALGWKAQRARVREAQRLAEEARRLAEEKMSDSVYGRSLAHAIRALDAKPSERPRGLDPDIARPDPILVEMADRFFPMPKRGV